MRAPYSRNLFDLICEQAGHHSDRLAVISGDARVTYRELEHRARLVGSPRHRRDADERQRAMQRKRRFEIQARPVDAEFISDMNQDAFSFKRPEVATPVGHRTPS